ncbi:MAG: hypothetical protein HC945_02225 [Nitrosarchaeum sp.]|nr:hypothetical protein [Nitrosarchaeum sp.]
MLKRRQLALGFWPLITSAVAFITAAQIAKYKGADEFSSYCTVVALLLFFFIALIKYWDTMELTE